MRLNLFSVLKISVGKQVDLVWLYFSAAFDKVSHPKLFFFNLSQHGVKRDTPN